MQIKLDIAKSIYGKKVSAGTVLTVGADIPEWQAKKFLELSIASEHIAPAKKKAAKIKDA